MFSKKPVDVLKKIPMTPYAETMAEFNTTDPYLSDADLMWYAGWMVNCFVDIGMAKGKGFMKSILKSTLALYQILNFSS